jgi:hypothetical protein
MTLLAQKEEAVQQLGLDAAQAAAGTDQAGLALTPHQKSKPLGKPFRVPTTARSI